MIMADLPEPAEEDEAMLLSWARTRRCASTWQAPRTTSTASSRRSSTRPLVLSLLIEI